MVCSCAMPSNYVWLQIIFSSCVRETVLYSFLRSLLPENGRSHRFPRIFIKKNKLGDRMIKQSLNSVIAKYHDLSVSRRSIICLSLWLRQTIYLLATDKSRYFAQPCPIILLIIANTLSHRQAIIIIIIVLLSLCSSSSSSSLLPTHEVIVKPSSLSLYLFS